MQQPYKKFEVLARLSISLFFTLTVMINVGLVHAQDVIRASGGTELSIDNVNGSYSNLSGPTIRETASGQLAENGTIILTLPTGYEWNTALTGGDITLTIEPTGAANTQLAVSFTSITATTVTITVNTPSTTRGNGQGPGRVQIGGLQLRPTNTTVPDNATITNTGTTGPNVNYGNLSKKPGAITQVRVETAADGSGQVVQAQDILAGNSLTVFSIGRDTGGNFVENKALADEADWSLIDVTGGIEQASLTPASNLRSASFASQQTGTAKIEAVFSGAASTPSQDITVLPRPADEIIINTQPPSTAIAGEEYSNPTVVHLLDQFGNIVTTDNSTMASISINSGEGTLSGTLTQQASNGSISFPGLSSDIANTIDLRIESDGLSSITTNSILIEPNDPVDLLYLQQPTNTAQNGTISPPVEVRLLDNFGNHVLEDGINVSISEEDYFKNSSTFLVQTNADGIALFDNLEIRNNSDTGEVNFDASFPDITSPVTSNSFFIISAGDLAKFVIESPSEADISNQEAGEEFTIRIRALDGADNVFTDFNDSVVLTADSDIQEGGSQVASITTENFVDGVLETNITLTSVGPTRIYAENTDVNRSGQSNEFSVLPTNFDASTSIISANPNEIVADGSSMSTITVQLRDEFNNDLMSGGEMVELSTNAGTFSGGVSTITATDQNNGSYTATLISSTNADDTAAITGTVNSVTIGDNATVDFTAGDVASFLVQLPQDNGSPATQTAGVGFDISIEAIDNAGNRVTGFNGDVTLTSNSVFSSGENVTLTDGIITNHSITLTRSGNSNTITATADDLFEVDGTSETFPIVANTPDANASQIIANPNTLQNDPNFESEITIILRDMFNNRVRTQQPVNISLEQLEENNSPSSGNPDASIQNGITFNPGPATYTATLVATNTVELVELTGLFNSTELSDKVTVNIVIPNTWTAGAGGPGTNRTDWTNPDNWTSGVPTETDFVVIPDIGEVPTLDLNIDIGSFEIQQGVSLVLFGGNAITVSGNVRTDGDLNIEDNTDILVGGNFIGNGSFTAGENATIEVGGNISLTNFLARTEGTFVTLNGSSSQTISTQNFLAQNLNIRNDVTVAAGTNLLDVNVLDIGDGYNFELEQGAGITFDSSENITGNGTFLLNDNTLVLRNNAEFGNIDASEGTVIFGIRLDEDFADFPDLQQQQIANLSEMKSAIINNSEGVRTFDDIIIGEDGELTLQNGPLIISSGSSFIASNINYENGFLRFRRNISGKGWKMMATPVESTFGDFFSDLTVQGLTGSTYPNRQPNILSYDESFEGTDNQRWRSPGDVTDQISAGTGYFFFVFGNEDGDTDYNDTLPVTLTSSGQENIPQAGDFTFPVTYTAEADTGWNLVGNPYGSTLNWDAPGWTKENMDNVIYVWNPATNQYLTWNGVNGSLGSGKISSFQAFWVKANAEDPVLQVPNSAKTTGGVFRKEAPDNNSSAPSFALHAETSEYGSSTHFTFTEEGSFTIDRLDAYRLLPFETENYTSIYSFFKDGTELAINNMPRRFGAPIEIPIQVDAIRDGAFYDGLVTLTWPEIDQLPDGWSVTLLDRNSEKEINLREQDFYDFDIQSRGKVPPVINRAENFRLLEKSQAKARNARFMLIIEPGEDSDELPKVVSLDQNYPNPFNPATKIKFGLPLEDRVRIDVYDILGRQVQTITNRRYQAGFHEVEFDGRALASGVYFYRLTTSNKVLNKKMTLIK